MLEPKTLPKIHEAQLGTISALQTPVTKKQPLPLHNQVIFLGASCVTLLEREVSLASDQAHCKLLKSGA